MDDISALKALTNLGYLSFGEDPSSDFIRAGVREFQIAYCLADKSGDLNEETLQALGRPRCGFPDREILEVRVFRERRVASLGRFFSLRAERRTSDPVTVDPKPWPNVIKPFTLFYEFGEGAGDKRKKAVLRAMNQWSSVKDGKIVRFQLANGSPPHFTIGWISAAAMEANYVAVACLPLDCNLPMPMRFNEGKPWSAAVDPDSTSFSVETVALHEIGHILGLVHPAENNDSIMSAELQKGEKPDLKPEDRKALRHLYSS